MEMIEIEHIITKQTHLTVCFSTGETIRLPIACERMYGLAKGKVIDRPLYQQLKEESEKFMCRRKALDYLSIRNRSTWEIERYLQKKGFGKDPIRETIIFLREAGYINDYDYAVRYINARRSRKTIGKRLLRAELYRRGVDRNIISRALAETGSNIVNADEIYALAVKKANTLKSDQNKMRKIMYFLRQRGFGEDDIRAVVERLKKENIEI